MIKSLRDANCDSVQPEKNNDVFFSNLKKYIDELSAPLDVIIRYHDEKGLNSGVKV